MADDPVGPAGPVAVVAASGLRPARPKSPSGRPPAGLLGTALAVGLVFTAPFAYLVYRNAVLGGALSPLIRSSATLDPLLRTLVLAVSVTVTAATIGTGLAWLVTRADLPGRRAWRLLAPLPLVIPSFVGAAALVAGLAPGGLIAELLDPLGIDRLPRFEGLPAAFMVLSLLSYPYVLLPVAARLASLPPSLEESARLLGRSPGNVFRTVVLPQTASAIWAGALLVFLYVLSDFGAVSILRYDTLTRSIYAGRLFDQPRSIALSLILGLLAVSVVAAERLLRRRTVVSTSRGRPSLLVPLGRWKAPALGLTGAVVGLGLIAPVSVLGFWAVRGLVNAETAVSAVAADPGQLVQPALNTSVVGVVTAVAAVAVVLPVARLTARHRSRVGDLPNAMVVGGFALPGLVIALALAFWARQLPGVIGLYQSFPLLVLAYVVHFGAQGLRSADVAVAGVPRHVEEAAQVLGAGRWRRFAAVELPLMRPGLLAGAGLVLLSTMKELPATLLLAPIGFETLATRVWQANSEGFLAETGLTSLVLLALSGGLTWALVIRRADRLA